MDEEIGIDKDKILGFSKTLREAWNEFFWKFRVCQRHIRFSREERSNYIGDLFNYFDDIIHHLGKFNMKPDYLSSLYETTAVLQFMYVQQDLIDELLRLFKLNKSSSNDKNFIRNLRNELIGHPISRDYKGDLTSSVFITGSTKNSTLSYIRYHKDNDYKFDLIVLNWRTIFETHNRYLEIYLTSLIQKVNLILSHFEKNLLKIAESVEKVSFEKLVAWVNQVFETYSNNDALFFAENILHCYQRQIIHERYRHAVSLFRNDLVGAIKEVIKEIKELNFLHEAEKGARVNNVVKVVISDEDFEKILFSKETEISENGITKETVKIVISNEGLENNRLSKTKKINYEFGKLYEKHIVFGLDYFKREFYNDNEIIQELDNMANNNHDAEFYCSYEYLRLLFKQRDLL